MREAIPVRCYGVVDIGPQRELLSCPHRPPCPGCPRFGEPGIAPAAHAAPVRLFELSIKDKKIKRITDNDDWIEDFEVSRDKKMVVMSANRELSYAWDQKTPPATYLVNLGTGERKELFEGEEDAVAKKEAGRVVGSQRIC